MAHLILGLGSNLGDRAGNLERALNIISGAFAAGRVSPVYSSRSLLNDGQEDYYNIVCSCRAEGRPEEVLDFFQDAEKKIGRVKNTGRWGARAIDIDILDWDGSIMETERLRIPHPGIPHRSFVLYPLRDIFPDYRHPETGLSPDDMIRSLEDDLRISRVSGISCRFF